jgi:transcriptional regulator with XRE-family HTH domain
MTQADASRDLIAIGQIIRERRFMLGLTWEGLARKANISRSTLSSLEAGRNTRPQPLTLKNLAQAIRVPVEDFLGDPVIDGDRLVRSM